MNCMEKEVKNGLMAINMRVNINLVIFFYFFFFFNNFNDNSYMIKIVFIIKIIFFNF
jgi:hypothetical protein